MRLPKYVTAFKDRHGKWRFRYRRKGYKSQYINAELGSKEFWDALSQIETSGPERNQPTFGTFDMLIEAYYKSPRWQELETAHTRRTYENIIERFRKPNGHRMVAHTDVNDIDREIQALTDAPTTRNRARKLLVNLFDYAIKLGLITENPARLADRYKVHHTGYHTWTEDEITAFEKRHKPNTRARLAMHLMLYTGQRRGDMVKMKRSDIQGGRIHVTQGKTGKKLAIAVHPRLAETILSAPTGKEYLLETSFGKPFKAAGFGNWFRTRCDQAGLKNCTAHGLRKAMARRLAEIGMSNQQIKALTGHSKDDEVALYTAAANQVKIADDVVEKLAAWEASNV